MILRRARRRVLARVLTAFALATITACGATGDVRTNPGVGNVVVVASAGTTPIYSWTGPFAVSINVVRTSVPSVAVWGISSPVDRDIASGSRQGVVPSGATETATAERTLASGTRYRVTVSLTDGTSGSVDFTP